MRDQVVEFVLQFLEESKVQVLSRAHSNGEELERAKQFVDKTRFLAGKIGLV